jgi:hypothetical protein
MDSSDIDAFEDIRFQDFILHGCLVNGFMGYNLTREIPSLLLSELDRDRHGHPLSTPLTVILPHPTTNPLHPLVTA